MTTLFTHALLSRSQVAVTGYCLNGGQTCETLKKHVNQPHGNNEGRSRKVGYNLALAALLPNERDSERASTFTRRDPPHRADRDQTPLATSSVNRRLPWVPLHGR